MGWVVLLCFLFYFGVVISAVCLFCLFVWDLDLQISAPLVWVVACLLT